MSESNLRASTPLSASPGRVSRPHWPWLPTYSHRSSQSVQSAMSSTVGTSQGSASWDQRSSLTSIPTVLRTRSGSAARNFNLSSSMIFTRASHVMTQDTTRHWTFTVCARHKLVTIHPLTSIRRLSGLSVM